MSVVNFLNLYLDWFSSPFRIWNDIGLSLSWFSFQTRRHGWKTALELNTSGIAVYGEQERLNGKDHDLGTYLFIVWHKVRKTRVCTRRDQPLSKKIITKIYSEKPRRGTTGTIESMQRSINSVQRNLGRDWSELELGRWREGFRVFFKV